MKKIIPMVVVFMLICNMASAFTRTPSDIAEVIKDKIQGKVVCDIGSAEGDWMIAMSKYAKEVKGIDNSAWMVEIATDRGLNVIQANAISDTLPEADVYYVYFGTHTLKDFMKRIDASGVKGTFIFGHTNDYIVEQYFLLRGAEVRSGAGGHFKVYILEIK